MSFLHRRRHRLVTATAVISVGTVLSACASGSRPLPPGPAQVDVVMREYAFEFTPPRRAGRIVFRARNAGRADHELKLLVLPEDVPQIGEQLRSSGRRLVPSVATMLVRPPGRTGSFAVELTPGRYALVCFAADPDGVQHAHKGMASEFRLRA